MTDYVPIHQHSEHSFLDGYASVQDMAARAKEMGMRASAITDHGECGGHMQFHKACVDAGIKPILGMEAYWVWDVATTMQTRSKGNSHITLLAHNQQGLRNLWALSSRAYEHLQAGRRPLADVSMMREHAEGLWASDGCLLTEFAATVERGDEARCREIYGTLAGVFGDRFFVELHTWQLVDPKTDKDRELNAKMSRLNQAKARIAQEMGLPIAVVNDNHYVRPEDWENHALVWEMNTHGTGDQLERGRAAGHLMSDEEIVMWMGRHGISRSVTEEAIRVTAVIGEDCDVEIPRTLEMPRLTGSDEDDNRLFISLVEEGFRRKVGEVGLDVDRYADRAAMEMQIIVDKGFAGYFNIVADYASAAKTGEYGKWIGKGAQPGMLVGPARGSAGGSLVAWLMDITGVDPLKYGLLFERFISPARKDWPDIDIDFPQSQRDDVKDYLVARHGEDKVCGIGTRSTSRPKGVLADLCRVMGVEFEERMKISRIFDAARDDDYEEILKRQGEALRPFMRKHPKLFEKIGEMVGIVRQPGTHAAGVVVNNEPIMGRVPTRRVKGQVTTQFDMHEVELLGGVKDDLLGLRHLDTLQAARDLILERTGRDVDYYAFGDAELRDPAIWPAVDAGDTAGVFQLETSGGTEDAMRFRPRSEVDVADLISVNRPGVIDAGLKDKYMARRAGYEPDVFDHPLMEGIVGDTHGILVYQEQLMRAARVLAGFTAEEAEGLRKVIGKKQAEKLPALEKQFVEGCLANPEFTGAVRDPSAAERAARKVWTSINAAGRYAFNKCAIGSTQVKLAASNSASNGYMRLDDMWRRLYDLAPPGEGKPGEPCRFCGRPAVRKGRGQCGACLAWRSKFRSNHPKRGLKAWSLSDDGRLHPNRIVDVHQNGVRRVWRVELENGQSITTTTDHRHMTPDGWREVGELAPGDELLVCGGYEDQTWEPDRMRTTAGSRAYVGNRLPNSQRVGENAIGYIDGGYLALKEWTDTQEWACSEPGCERSRSNGDRIERAHLNGDRTNNAASNLAMKCASHHKAYDYAVNGRRRRGEKGYPAVPARIVSVEYEGEEMTYDLEMADPYHSWVGNGVVTHNSHAVGYALISTWEIWLKHHYGVEFLVALMQTDTGNATKYARDLRRRGVELWPPDVNLSDRKMRIDDLGVRYGLDSVRGVGDAAVDDILSQRPYVSFDDFYLRVDPSLAGRKEVVENLLFVGAFDSLGDRGQLVRTWRAYNRDRSPVPDFTDLDVVARTEKELIGHYVTADPMSKYAHLIDDVCVKSLAEVHDAPAGEVLKIGGQITSVRPVKVKRGREKGRDMAHMTVAWGDEEYDIAVFSDMWASSKPLLKAGAPVICQVLKSERGVHLSLAARLDMLNQEGERNA